MTAPEQARFANVIVDAPLAEALQYSSAHFLGERGALCIVPLGRRKVVGVCVDRSTESAWPAEKLREVAAAIDGISALSDDWLELTRFAADYYQASWGQVAVPALPPLLRRPPGPRWTTSVQRLRREPDDDRGKSVPVPMLNDAQRSAAEAIAASRGFAAFLLHGITGSGKTEVYFEAVERVLARSAAAQALLLVPEINLTPQLEERLRARFPQQTIVTLHSGMADAQRSAAWLAAHEQRARIVLGTRLAVFASLPGLAVIVVDEEHDASFKAGDGVRYSARDLAVKRAQLAQTPVVLGSATPALESWHGAQVGRYRLLRLPARAGSGALPVVELIDIGADRPIAGLAAPLREALLQTVGRGEQALVYINRRGYAPVLSCESCGWLSKCPRCDAFAAFHKSDTALHCHHCGWQMRVPRACPTCGNQDLHIVGHGTQRIEEALTELLPQARIGRLDRDSARRRNAGRDQLHAVHAGEVDVLVGTQMIAKGHDFRRVSLVGALNVDAALAAADFRAPERLFATLMQVAGRAGRSGLPSRVLIQTRYPAHPLFAALKRFDYDGFAESQLAQREAAGLPPFAPLALLGSQASKMDTALGWLAAARRLAESMDASDAIRLYDPVPMPLAQKAGVHRAQLLIEGRSRGALQSFLRRWLASLRQAAGFPAGVRWHVEVDPQEI